MDHVAIMKKSWGLIPKILSGEKKIESRGYKNMSSPWGKIKSGEKIFFKDSGEPVAIKAEVKKVLQFSDLTPKKIKEILRKYGRRDGLTQKDIPKYYKMFKDKKYCLLIFLKNPREVAPFGIDKKGFGAMASWLSVRKINLIKI